MKFISKIEPILVALILATGNWAFSESIVDGGDFNQDSIWNGRNDSGLISGAGVYFYTIRTESFSETNKMILLKIMDLLPFVQAQAVPDGVGQIDQDKSDKTQENHEWNM